MSRVSHLPVGLRIEGEIRGTGDLVIGCELDGPIAVEGLVVIEASAAVRGDVRARALVVKGSLVGSAVTDETIRIEPGARMVGDARGERVTVVEGALLRGRITMTGSSIRKSSAGALAAVRSSAGWLGAPGASSAGAVAAPRVEAPRVEAPRVEAPRVEVPRVEAPRVEAPRVEAPRVEAPRVEAPRVEAPSVVPAVVRARPPGSVVPVAPSTGPRTRSRDRGPTEPREDAVGPQLHASQALAPQAVASQPAAPQRVSAPPPGALRAGPPEPIIPALGRTRARRRDNGAGA